MHFSVNCVSSPSISMFVSIISHTVINLTHLGVWIHCLLLGSSKKKNHPCASSVITTVISKIRKTKCVIKGAVETHLHDFLSASHQHVKHSHQSGTRCSAGVKGGFVSGVSYFLDLTVLSTAYGHLRTTVLEK